MRKILRCKNCHTLNIVTSKKPLREQFCRLCRWAIELDDPSILEGGGKGFV